MRIMPTGQWSEPVTSGMMKRFSHRWQQIFTDEKVVDSPAHVPRPRPRLDVPVRVLVRLLVKVAECVRVPVGDELVHPGPFFGEEAGLFRVLLGARDIYFFMGGIDVPADDQSFPGSFKGIGVFEKNIVESHLIFKSLRAHLAVGEIDVKQGKTGILGDDNASFQVEAVFAEVVADVGRLFFSKHGHAGVSLSLRMVPVGMVACRLPQVGVKLLGVAYLGLLEAEDVRRFLIQPVQEAFAFN